MNFTKITRKEAKACMKIDSNFIVWVEADSKIKDRWLYRFDSRFNTMFVKMEVGWVPTFECRKLDWDNRKSLQIYISDDPNKTYEQIKSIAMTTYEYKFIYGKSIPTDFGKTIRYEITEEDLYKEGKNGFQFVQYVPEYGNTKALLMRAKEIPGFVPSE